MRTVILLGCVLVMLGLVGCAMITPNTVVGTPTTGWLYTEIKYPHPRTEVVNDGIGSKRGEAMIKNIVGLVAIGDASIETAMRNGKITKVYTVDHDMMSILGVYTEWKTVVTGE